MADLHPVAERLRAILEPYRGSLVTTADDAQWLTLAFAPDDPHAFVAGVRLGKSYVSFYLMPVYALPNLLDDVSPGLRRRMQGKSCFNFARVDEDLFAELEQLTDVSIRRYRELRPATRAPAEAPAVPNALG